MTREQLEALAQDTVRKLWELSPMDPGFANSFVETVTAFGIAAHDAGIEASARIADTWSAHLEGAEMIANDIRAAKLGGSNG